ncbi:MAG: dTDP-4-dehydrorhamnose reductase [Bacteroidales bacterium]|nr:dTDP-4-dehydrorhamnose reductase [Bacteroidales bacterium]
MKILVTGACGQLGRTLMDIKDEDRHQYIFTDAYPAMDGVLPLDICDADAVDRMVGDNGVQVIVNCAAYTDVAKAETQEDTAFKVNAEAPGALAKAAARSGAVLIHISTDYVFDGKSAVAYGEDAEPAPLSAYGRSKFAGELAVLASGCRHIIIRSAWLFSRYGKNFVKTILEKTSSQPSVKVVEDQIGTPTFAGDLAEFIMYIIDNDMLDKEGVYNYTNEGVCSWYDLAWEVCDLSGHLCDVIPCKTSDFPTGVVRPAFSVLDKTKVKQTFLIEIPHWKDSLRFCMANMA